jgi:AcrR family transcriptional regulator
LLADETVHCAVFDDKENFVGTPGPARRLNTDDVIHAAFEVVRADGFGALSIRRVAGGLGLSPNALYTYVPDRAGLLREMVERVMAAIPLAMLTDPALPPGEALERFGLALRATVLAHPGGATLMMTGPLDGARALAMNEALLQRLTGAGLPLDDAARAAYALQVFVLGTVMLEAADGGDGDPQREEALAVERRAALEQYPVDGLVLTAQTGDIVARYNTTEQFAWGLRRVIAGMLTAS